MLLRATELWGHYRVTRPFRLPEQGASLWRGVIGRSLRQVGCLQPAPCADSCVEPQRCPYARLFDPALPSPPPHRLLRGMSSAPPPLIPLLPAARPAPLACGARLDLGIRVLGPLSPADRGVLLATLQNLAAFPLGNDGGRLSLTGFGPLDASAGRDHSIDPALPFDAGARRQLRLHIDTPAWLEQDGALLATPALDFRSLFLHSYRRLTAVCSLYGTYTPEDDSRFLSLGALAGQVQTVEQRISRLHWSRSSSSTGQPQPMHGIVGTLLFAGPLDPFIPYLQLAEVAHIGKSTSFGLGRIRVEPLRPEAPLEQTAE